MSKPRSMPCSETIRGRCMSVSWAETRAGATYGYVLLPMASRAEGVGPAYAGRKKTGRENSLPVAAERPQPRGEQGGRCGCRRCRSNLSSTAKKLPASCDASQSHTIDARFLRVNVGTVKVCSLTDTRRRPYAVQARYPKETRHERRALELPTRGCSTSRCSRIGRCNGRLDARHD